MSARAPALNDESPPGVPRWVKVSALVAMIVILAAIGAMIFVGGAHSPGRHLHGHHAVAGQLTPAVIA